MAAPKLRFKEFDGDWVSANIQSLVDQNILDKPMDGNHGEIHPTSADYVENGIPFVMATDVFDGKVHLNKSKKITKEQADTLRKGFSIEGDILLTHKATIGNVAKVPELETPYIMLTPQVTYYRILDQEKLLADFMKSNFESVTFQNELIALCTGATRLYIGISEQRKLPFSYPSKPEQTKIASFLSNVDEKISQLTQKHALLSQYKQGMMQKLFSQQIRFKADDGSEFGEWQNKTLSNFIIKHIGGASLKPSDFVEQSEYEVIPKKAIVQNGYLNLDKDNPTYCSEDFFKANLKNTVDNTYLVTVLRDLVPSGPSIGYIVRYMENTQYILAQGVYGFKLKEELNKDFLIHFSNTKAYRLVMQSIMVGSTQVHIRNQDFFGIEIPVPCLEEQTKIADFLSAIDQKIEVVAQQIEQAKQWKKGLLQQMFV